MRIISIVGPTASGKTSFVLELAQGILENKSYSGIDLVSADSRQVYQGLEIISGADIPEDFKRVSINNFSYDVYQHGDVTLHGVNIITPDHEWSVTHFQDLAIEVINLAKKKNRLVIIIGGTGLYHDQLFNLNPALRVKPKLKIREKAKQMDLVSLQKWAEEVNPERFKKLNNSDVNNPRRLIRIIEIGSEKIKESSGSLAVEQIYVGLNLSLEEIKKRIDQRVRERFAAKAVEEVKSLQKKYQDWSLPALSALGVSEVSRLINGLFSEEECLSQWALHEFQYAKRQLTWWKKKQVTWFKIDNLGWKEEAFAYILSLC